MSHIYKGHLANDPHSLCFGDIVDGIFDGQIHTQDGIYYVEQSNRYFENYAGLQKSPTFHSVIYHESNIVNSHENRGTSYINVCRF